MEQSYQWTRACEHTYVFLKGCTTEREPLPADEAWVAAGPVTARSAGGGLTEVEKCLEGTRERCVFVAAVGEAGVFVVLLFARKREVVWFELK